MSKKGNGEGTIYFVPSRKRWCGQYVIGRDDTGKLIRKTVYGKTRKEVSEKINEYLTEIKNNEYIDKNDITLDKCMHDKVDLQYNLEQVKSTTYKRNLYTIRIIEKCMPKIAYSNIQDITIADINNNLRNITKYSQNVIDKCTMMMNSTFNYAVINKLVKENPFSIKGAIIKPKKDNKKKVVALTLEEQQAFVNELQKYYEPYRTILFIALYSGMRIGEILTLTYDDIDLENKVIHVSKTLTRDENDKTIVGKTTKTYSGQRDVPIISALYNVLNSYEINHTGILFTKDNKLITPSTINAHLKRICTKANIRPVKVNSTKCNKKGEIIQIRSSEVHTHMLRHTFATRCIESGMQAVTLSRILGHKDISVTLNTYTDVFNQFKQKEVNKLDEYLSRLQSGCSQE